MKSRASEKVSEMLNDVKRKIDILVEKTGEDAERLAGDINKEIDDILDWLRK